MHFCHLQVKMKFGQIRSGLVVNMSKIQMDAKGTLPAPGLSGIGTLLLKTGLYVREGSPQV